MAKKVKVELLRPLNGAEVGSTANYSKADAARLEKLGSVKVIGEADDDDDAGTADDAADNRDIKRSEAPANKREAAPANKSK